MKRILLIEDTFGFKENVKAYFAEIGNDLITFDTAGNCNDGLDKIKKGVYDLIFVDQNLSGDSDIDLCRRIMENSTCPIIYITSMNEFDDVRFAYALGTYEFMIKPISPEEIWEKILEHLRGEDNYQMPTLECCGLRMNQLTGLTTLDGHVVYLSDKATDILRLLLENKPNAVSRETILKKVWGEKYKGNIRVVDIQIQKLRLQLGGKGGLIQTVRGRGYRIDRI